MVRGKGTQSFNHTKFFLEVFLFKKWESKRFTAAPPIPIDKLRIGGHSPSKKTKPQASVGHVTNALALTIRKNLGFHPPVEHVITDLIRRQSSV